MEGGIRVEDLEQLTRVYTQLLTRHMVIVRHFDYEGIECSQFSSLYTK